VETLKPLQHCVSVIKGKSADVSKQFADASLEFVFIDASHDYESVKEDIEAWLPKVKVGGIVGGDDYQWEGVNKAVQELVPDAKSIGVRDSNWFWVKE
jgi:predicted O-methyltransferase YrrM